MPTREEAANTFLWRERDATKNSISMAARTMYSHGELQDREMQELLFQKGINWNDYPPIFKRGTFVLRRRVERPFTAVELGALPPRHEARSNPALVVERVEVRAVELPPLGRVTNRAACSSTLKSRSRRHDARMRIALVTTDSERLECFEVLKELRTDLVKDRFLETLARMSREGFSLAALWDEGEVRAVCGFRPMEMLATGKLLYVDDLVTASKHRGRGYGATLLTFMKSHAVSLGCAFLELDSGSRRLDAHRFYKAQGLEEIALHFSLPLGGQRKWTEPDLSCPL